MKIPYNCSSTHSHILIPYDLFHVCQLLYHSQTLYLSLPVLEKITQDDIASCNSLGNPHARERCIILIFVNRDVYALETKCSSREGDRIPVRSWLAIIKESRAVAWEIQAWEDRNQPGSPARRDLVETAIAHWPRDTSDARIVPGDEAAEGLSTPQIQEPSSGDASTEPSTGWACTGLSCSGLE